MPNFKKSTGYKMKGFTYPGESPAKVSSQSLVDAQAELDHTELDFRQPGWATAASTAHKHIKKTASMGMLKDKGSKTEEGADKEKKGGGGGGGEGGQSVNVQDILSKTGDLAGSSSTSSGETPPVTQ